jgi:hypothetical protein
LRRKKPNGRFTIEKTLLISDIQPASRMATFTRTAVAITTARKDKGGGGADSN